ncbi:MAG: AbrB/MazE/SpoVT family DNA-binding domain-containing protein [Candidatus Omnitrophota bacterium]|nr:AbrB/MazE/SpoVT family DNA-binding domain-containing protein [Candidatus Omnitrophota bacterium]
MPVATLTSKGQMTLPQEVREALHLKPSDKVVVIAESNRAVLYPLTGNILDLGGTVKIPSREKPMDFHKVRTAVGKKIGRERRS